MRGSTDVMNKLRIGILGTGNIGTDLLIKVLRSDFLECICFAGRNPGSPGMLKAVSLGVNVSDKGIDAFIDKNLECDLVFDATSALDHYRHARTFSVLGIKAIDMTPAHIGEFCVPSINPDIINTEPNVNMVTCGGQASIPPIYALSTELSSIEKVEISSLLASDSVGPATLANIDKYYASTAKAVKEYSGAREVSVELNVDESEIKPDMRTRIRVHSNDAITDSTINTLNEFIKKVQTYVPGYKLDKAPSYGDGYIELFIVVRGRGDWVPKHAGNLDIINCAAIEIAEKFAQKKYDIQPKSILNKLFSSAHA